MMSATANVKPYTSWVDFMEHLKHPESLVNFIAAYGTHPTAVDVADDLGRNARRGGHALVLGGGDDHRWRYAQERRSRRYSDRLDFLNSTGHVRNNSAAHAVKDLDGVTTTGRRQHRLLGRRSGRGADAVRRSARFHVQLRVREPARGAAERRSLLLPVAHGRPALRHRAREQHVLPAGDAEQRRDASSGQYLLDPDVDT